MRAILYLAEDALCNRVKGTEYSPTLNMLTFASICAALQYAQTSLEIIGTLQRNGQYYCIIIF